MNIFHAETRNTEIVPCKIPQCHSIFFSNSCLHTKPTDKHRYEKMTEMDRKWLDSDQVIIILNTNCMQNSMVSPNTYFADNVVLLYAKLDKGDNSNQLGMETRILAKN